MPLRDMRELLSATRSKKGKEGRAPLDHARRGAALRGLLRHRLGIDVRILRLRLAVDARRRWRCAFHSLRRLGSLGQAQRRSGCALGSELDKRQTLCLIQRLPLCGERLQSE